MGLNDTLQGLQFVNSDIQNQFSGVDPTVQQFAQNGPAQTITSAYRDPQRNAQVGGVPTSLHQSGQALDIRKGENSQQIMDYYKQNGFKVLDEGTHIHVEMPQGSTGQGYARNDNSGRPYLPSPEFDVKKPGLAATLQAISGLVGIAGGGAANIISAKNRISPTGNEAANLGQNQLNQFAKTQDDYEKQQRAMDYLKDPRINPKDASLAASFIRTGNVDKGLSILENAQNASIGLSKSLQLQQGNLNNYFAKVEQKEATEKSKFGRYYDLYQKSLTDIPMTDKENKEFSNLSAEYGSKKMSIDPNTDPKFAKDREDISKGFGMVEKLSSIGDNYLAAASKLDGGRYKGPALTLKNIFASSPDLLEMQLDANALMSIIPRGFLDEKGRLPAQIEERLAKLRNGQNLSADELKVIGNFFHRVKDTQMKTLSGNYAAIGNSSPAALKQMMSKRRSMQEAMGQAAPSQAAQSQGNQPSDQEILDAVNKSLGVSP